MICWIICSLIRYLLQDNNICFEDKLDLRKDLDIYENLIETEVFIEILLLIFLYLIFGIYIQYL